MKNSPLTSLTLVLTASAVTLGCSGGSVSTLAATNPVPAQVSAGPVAASASRFLVDGLKGKVYQAPTSRGESCAIAVDADGNATLTWRGFGVAQGQLQLPVEALSPAEQQTPTRAHYVVQYHKAHGTPVAAAAMARPEQQALVDSYSVTLQDEGGIQQATVMANGLAGDPRSVTCSTANHAPLRWRQLAAHVGTWRGQPDPAQHLGNLAACSLDVAADGTLRYTDSRGQMTQLSAQDWALYPHSNGTQFDLMQFGTPLRLYLQWGTGDAAPQVRYTQSGDRYDQCQGLVKV